MERDTLTRLAAKVPLGLVTGRPRSDAERFLSEHRIDHLFQTVVTMEDAPVKPDPAPVSLALGQLGLRRAWMIGDTPDDLHAARSAKVLPIGIVAPGDDPGAAQSALADAGAARILTNVSELLEILQ